jgi:hypothetical protein
VNISNAEQFIEPQVSLRGQRIVPAGRQPERRPMCLISLMVTPAHGLAPNRRHGKKTLST